MTQIWIHAQAINVEEWVIITQFGVHRVIFVSMLVFEAISSQQEEEKTTQAEINGIKFVRLSHLAPLLSGISRGGGGLPRLSSPTKQQDQMVSEGKNSMMVYWEVWQKKSTRMLSSKADRFETEI